MYEGEIRADLAQRIKANVIGIRSAPRYQPRKFQTEHLPAVLIPISDADYPDAGSEILAIERRLRVMIVVAEATKGEDGAAELACEPFFDRFQRFIFQNQRFEAVIDDVGNRVAYLVRILRDGGIQSIQRGNDADTPVYTGIEFTVEISTRTYIEDVGV